VTNPVTTTANQPPGAVDGDDGEWLVFSQENGYVTAAVRGVSDSVPLLRSGGVDSDNVDHQVISEPEVMANDGKYHSVRLTRNANNVSLAVDNLTRRQISRTLLTDCRRDVSNKLVVLFFRSRGLTILKSPILEVLGLFCDFANIL